MNIRQIFAIATVSLLAATGVVALAPTGGADATWDFTVEYVDQGTDVSFSILGAIPSVMSCPAGWQTQTASSTRSGADGLIVYGSYLGKKLVIESVEGGVLDRYTYTCPTAVTLVNSASNIDPCTEAGWSVQANVPKRLAPLSEGYFSGWEDFFETHAYSCFATYIGTLAGLTQGDIPFTGAVDGGVLRYNPPWGESHVVHHHTSGLWIAGTGPWNVPLIVPADNDPAEQPVTQVGGPWYVSIDAAIYISPAYGTWASQWKVCDSNCG